MGKGGIRFWSLAGQAGLACAVLVAGCRTSRVEALGPDLQALGAGAERPSLVVGHRFGRWLEVEPEPPARPALERACLLEQTGATEDAISVLGAALDDLRECPSLFAARGALYLTTGFPRAAAGDFQRAVALAPERASCWYALGHAYEVLGLTRQAAEALVRALALGGDGSGLFLSLARVHRSLGRAGQAARHYESALRQHDAPPIEILVEAAVLATEDGPRSAGVESVRDRLDACRGTRLSDDAWLLRALLREMPGKPSENVVTAFRALEVAPAELADLTRSLLTAVQLVDPETGAETRASLLASEPDEQRRALLERCLSRP
jgi:tetratricopeptide (TPR) repeat protein